METSPTAHVKKSRKRYPCDWCYESIEKDEPYSKWFAYDESTTTRMHPECYQAMLRADLFYEELPPPGTYRRGCYCGENKEHCKCPSLKDTKEPRCFRCDKLIESSGKDESPWEMAAGAVILDGGGSFGSRIYDTLMDGISIRILACDDCLKVAKNKVLETSRKETGND